jgi:intracellular sulfur oxidation DsrE/DsrF family protein
MLIETMVNIRIIQCLERKFQMFKKNILPLFTALALAFSVLSPSAFAAGDVHKVDIHVDENDKSRMNMALNNAQNVNKYYQEKGDTVEIELVVYGPGLHMLREDTSPVKQRIAAMSLEMGNISFAACGNTKAKMTKKAGKEIKLISEAKIVPSGVVRLIELQENGWSYVRP